MGLRRAVLRPVAVYVLPIGPKKAAVQVLITLALAWLLTIPAYLAAGGRVWPPAYDGLYWLWLIGFFVVYVMLLAAFAAVAIAATLEWPDESGTSFGEELAEARRFERGEE